MAGTIEKRFERIQQDAQATAEAPKAHQADWKKLLEAAKFSHPDNNPSKDSLTGIGGAQYADYNSVEVPSVLKSSGGVKAER